MDTQEKGLTKILSVVQKLPNDCLDETEGRDSKKCATVNGFPCFSRVPA